MYWFYFISSRCTLKPGSHLCDKHKHKKKGTCSFFLVLMLMLISLVLCFSHKCEPGLRGEKLNYNGCTSLLLRKSQNLLFWLLKSSGHKNLPCLFESRFLQIFRTMPIFGMSRDHNRKWLKTRTEWIVFEIWQYILPKHGIIYNL